MDKIGSQIPDNASNKVSLPYHLGSMDKIKPGSDKLRIWLQKYNKGPYCISEKLDGLSGLLVIRCNLTINEVQKENFTLDTNSFPFQMQATVWKKSDMRSLYKTARSPLHLEPAADWPGCMRSLGLKGAYCYNDEPQQGKYHWGTSTYPHIVSAVQRGKWNTFQHDGIILEILNEYNIDPNDRGMRTQY